MCGIVYVKRKDNKPAYKSVLKRYRAQQGRGTDGYGYVAIQNGKVVSYNRSATEHGIIQLLSKETAPEILFHHRFPTSTPNIEEAAHPILVENPLLMHQYFVAHNGVIRNEDDLKPIHEKLGFKYTTEIMSGFMSLSSGKHYMDGEKNRFNDSEALAIETALALDGNKRSIDTEGSAAVIGIQTEGDRVVNRFFFRNSLNPLKYHEDAVMTSITSVGKGQEVAEKTVFKLRNDGGYEEFREGLQAPLNYIPMARSWEGGSTYPQLPGHKREGVGFVPPYQGALDDDFDMRFDSEEEAYDSERNNSKTHTVIKGPKIIDMRPLAEVIRDIEDLNKLIPFERVMALDDLWKEYDRCIGIEDVLNEEIQRLDVAVNSGSVDSAEAMLGRINLQEKLESLEGHMTVLESEINARKSLEK